MDGENRLRNLGEVQTKNGHPNHAGHVYVEGGACTTRPLVSGEGTTTWLLSVECAVAEG